MFVLCRLYVMYYRCKLPSSLWDWLTSCKLNLLFYALSAISPLHLECKLVSCDISLKETSVLSALLSDMAPQRLEGVWIWMKSPLACCHCCQNKLAMVLIKLLFTDKWWVTQITQVTINMTVYTCMITMMLLMLLCKLAACSSPHSVMTNKWYKPHHNKGRTWQKEGSGNRCTSMKWEITSLFFTFWLEHYIVDWLSMFPSIH